MAGILEKTTMILEERGENITVKYNSESKVSRLRNSIIVTPFEDTLFQSPFPLV